MELHNPTSMLRCFVNFLNSTSLGMAGCKVVYDVLIAGGGVMGLSTAYNLCKHINPSRICVVEKDPSYCRSATALSWASIRQQFSLPENIAMSQRSFQFIKDIDNHLRITDDDDVVDVNYKDGSYLFLATEDGASTLEANIRTQLDAGVKVSRYDKEQLQVKYPYLNVQDIVLGSDCSEGEGWFDPWLLLSAYRKKIKSLGVDVYSGRMTHFTGLKSANVLSNDGSTSYVHFDKFVNATGIHAKWTNEKLNSVLKSEQRFNLPVTPQRRQTFSIACKEGPNDVPLLLCPLKTVIRSEGDNYIVLYSDGPLVDEPSQLDDFGDVDDSHFVNDIWENLAYRIPCMEAVKILGGWAAYYEYNTLDQNALIGEHPLADDYYFINGFSGHGIQQSPAAGEYIAEVICGVKPHLNLTKVGLQRVLDDKPYLERNIL